MQGTSIESDGKLIVNARIWRRSNLFSEINLVRLWNEMLFFFPFRDTPNHHQPLRLPVCQPRGDLCGQYWRQWGADGHRCEFHWFSKSVSTGLGWCSRQPCVTVLSERHWDSWLQRRGKDWHLQANRCCDALWKYEVQAEAERGAGRARWHRGWRLFVLFNVIF